jgi:hypothetical protein
MWSLKETIDFVSLMPDMSDISIATTIYTLHLTGKISRDMANDACKEFEIKPVTTLEFWK